MKLLEFSNRPALLVSVRDSDEALAALDGGAHIIDVKEPARGSLGAADASIIAGVVQAVSGRAPVTAAAGELMDLVNQSVSPISDGVSLFKIGLAAARSLSNWPQQWKNTIAALCPRADAARYSVAVAYADWRTADAPPPDDVLAAALEFGCPALLVDTYDKSQGSLLDLWPLQDLEAFVRKVQSKELVVVLAGSLTGENIAAAARLCPDLIAVRTAACDGGRTGRVSRERVASLCKMISNNEPMQAHCAAAVSNDLQRHAAPRRDSVA